MEFWQEFLRVVISNGIFAVLFIFNLHASLFFSVLFLLLVPSLSFQHLFYVPAKNKYIMEVLSLQGKISYFLQLLRWRMQRTGS